MSYKLNIVLIGEDFRHTSVLAQALGEVLPSACMHIAVNAAALFQQQMPADVIVLNMDWEAEQKAAYLIKIRQAEYVANTPIIVCSAGKIRAYHNYCFANGATMYLQLPPHPRQYPKCFERAFQLLGTNAGKQVARSQFLLHHKA